MDDWGGLENRCGSCIHRGFESHPLRWIINKEFFWTNFDQIIPFIITISEQVVTETERVIARKVPQVLNDLRQAILASKACIVSDPSLDDVMAHQTLISHPADVPILLAAMRAKVDHLITFNRKHFIDDPSVAHNSGLIIGTPGDALRWVRGSISSEDCR